MEVPLLETHDFLEVVDTLPKISSRKQVTTYYWEPWSLKLFHGPALSESDSIVQALGWSIVGRTDQLAHALLPNISEDLSSLMIRFNNTAIVTWTDETRSGVVEKVNHSFGNTAIAQE